jgi:hypothetical protein
MKRALSASWDTTSSHHVGHAWPVRKAVHSRGNPIADRFGGVAQLVRDPDLCAPNRARHPHEARRRNRQPVFSTVSHPAASPILPGVFSVDFTLIFLTEEWSVPGLVESVHLTQLCARLVVVDGFVFDWCVHSNG